MRLINAHTGLLEEFVRDQIPTYAILSHTWGPEEATFEDWKNVDSCRGKRGFQKIWNACQQTKRDALQYLWCDTCCIDKVSSSELSEAINSMFSWYKGSTICYAYLDDVYTVAREMPSSRWFSRGWTLQELLAPTNVQFFNTHWHSLGNLTYPEYVYDSDGPVSRPSDTELAHFISIITGIEGEYLRGRPISEASAAQRMSWLSRRTTTRIEDMAYCMLGIFDIIMPLLYGEGAKAFVRLQQEIIKVSNDHTIFCWKWTPGVVPLDWASLLAPSPEVFQESGHIEKTPAQAKEEISNYSMTNAGLSIRLPTIPTFWYQLATLKATGSSSARLAIPIKISPGQNTFARYPFPHFPVPVPDHNRQTQHFYIGHKTEYPFELGASRDQRHAVLMSWNEPSLRPFLADTEWTPEWASREIRDFNPGAKFWLTYWSSNDGMIWHCHFHYERSLLNLEWMTNSIVHMALWVFISQ
ncbi:heterokaryon incompatibility protein-domain-containing protein [Apiospora rasikravindrae]|uniref:Heterokaryon incompatibility protein-domain-containing protein n=1 Tax=Apiospora rasikravindrae TaxID=990691 RepID=A0ABR1RVN9_9PEZI